MTVYLIVEYKNGEVIWTDGKSHVTKDVAIYNKNLYIKFYKRNSDLRILTLNLSPKKKK